MSRKPLPGQLGLGFFPEPTPPREVKVATKVSVATSTGPLDFIPHESATRKERLMLALQRDLATLAGPPAYCVDRSFYEERAAGYREMLT